MQVRGAVGGCSTTVACVARGGSVHFPGMAQSAEAGPSAIVRSGAGFRERLFRRVRVQGGSGIFAFRGLHRFGGNAELGATHPLREKQLESLRRGPGSARACGAAP